MLSVFVKLLPRIPVTLMLTGFSFALGFVFAAGIAFLKLRGNLPLRILAGAFITIIRCTPPVILFFLVFFGLPVLLSVFGVAVKSTDSNLSAVIAMTLMASGIMAEMLRAAFLSVDGGQYEAAVSVGLTPCAALLSVVFPQAFFIALPNLGNMIIALLHESSLAYLIGAIDVVGRAAILTSNSYGLKAASIYTVVTLIYWGLTVLLSWIVDVLVLRTGRANTLVTAGS
ncbi:MAG: ABC transporter permease subunit [Synergistaceae bacterium]|jgi:L-cystine transport system permease protein|nr:ABC transporter permease subunit [Synergistaceae bacterium]